jgi:hypothetical protein
MSVITSPIYSEFSGERKEIVNGKVIKDTSIHTEYDGKKLHIDKRNNNHFTHYTANNDTIKKLLNTPSSKMNLINRLNMDFLYKKTNKRKKGKTNKRKKVKTNKRKKGKRTKNRN